MKTDCNYIVDDGHNTIHNHLVSAYQKVNGSLQYFNIFTIKQDGYANNPDNKRFGFFWLEL
jgi:hypothetical protein